MAEALQFVLVGQVMGDAAQRVHNLVILALEDGLGELQLGHLLAVADLDLGARAQLPDAEAARRPLPGP